MKQITHQLAAHICTTDDQIVVIRSLEDALQAVQSEQKLATVWKAVPQPLQILLSTLKNDPDQLKRFLQQALTELRSLAVVRLTVPYVPTIQQAQELIQMVRTSLNPTVLVEFRTDASMLAGINIEYKAQRLQYALGQDLAELAMKEVHE